MSVWYKLCDAEMPEASPGRSGLQKLCRQGRAVLCSDGMAVSLIASFAIRQMKPDHGLQPEISAG